MNEGTAKFMFGMGDRVQMAESNEVGTVVGRAEYQASENAYYVRYRAGDGRQSECWWGESALKRLPAREIQSHLVPED